MIGAAYASVPLYRIFCQMTGYGGTTRRVEQYSDRILDQKITVRFDANVSGGLPWEFEPEAARGDDADRRDDADRLHRAQRPRPRHPPAAPPST